mgnify:CR=1 FL=1
MSYISGFSSYVGEKTPIADLADAEGYISSNIDELLNNGLAYYRKSNDLPYELAVSAVQDFSSSKGFDLSEIEVVIYATSTLWKREYSEREQMSDFLIKSGLENAYPIGVFGSGCANFHVALKMASGLVDSGAHQNVLIVTTDVAGGQKTRVIDPNVSIASDGAACALVSADKRMDDAYKVGSVEMLYGSVLAHINPKEARTEYFNEVAKGVKKTIRKTLEMDRLNVSDVSRVVTNNYNVNTLKMFTALAGFSESQLFFECVEDYAHCFASDSIICMNALHGSDASDDVVLVLGTGTQMWAGAMLYRD